MEIYFLQNRIFPLKGMNCISTSTMTESSFNIVLQDVLKPTAFFTQHAKVCFIQKENEH